MTIAKCLVSLKEAEISTACLQDDNFESKKELDDDLLHISNEIRIAINYLENIKNHGWKSFDTPDGLVWFGGKSHNELINHIPGDEIEDVNLEDIDFLVIGWQVQK